MLLLGHVLGVLGAERRDLFCEGGDLVGEGRSVCERVFDRLLEFGRDVEGVVETLAESVVLEVVLDEAAAQGERDGGQQGLVGGGLKVVQEGSDFGGDSGLQMGGDGGLDGVRGW